MLFHIWCLTYNIYIIICYITCMLYNMLITISFELEGHRVSRWPHLPKKPCVWDYVLLHSHGSRSSPASTSASASTSCGPCGSQSLGRLSNRPGCARLSPACSWYWHCVGCPIEGPPCFNIVLPDLPLPEPGAKGGISVQEAAEVSFTNI